MKLIILAGGKGTRISEYTTKIPKPMVEINSRPIITYIIDHYLKFGVKKIIVAGGYKIIHIKKSGEVVSEKNNKGNKAIDCPMTSSITISLLSFSGKLYV